MTSRPLTLDDCESIVMRLWPYLDGKLPDSDRAIVAGHLAHCTECQSHFDFARAFLEAVHTINPGASSDEGLRERVLAALSNEGYEQ